MFKFFKEVEKIYHDDDNVYDRIMVMETNIWNDNCISQINTAIEISMKRIYWESKIAIFVEDANGKRYKENNPSLQFLFNNDSFRSFLEINKILTSEDINKYLTNFHHVRNDDTHGAKYGKAKTKITNELKKDAYKFLFELCVNIYIFKFHKKPVAKWNDDYFKSLLKRPIN